MKSQTSQEVESPNTVPKVEFTSLMKNKDFKEVFDFAAESDVMI